jgi:hypothetical protein
MTELKKRTPVSKKKPHLKQIYAPAEVSKVRTDQPALLTELTLCYNSLHFNDYPSKGSKQILSDYKLKLTERRRISHSGQVSRT